MLKTCIHLLLAFTMVLTLSNCKKEKEVEKSEDLGEISLTATSTSNSIILSWPPYSGCSWYKILMAKSGESLAEVTTYQNLNDNPITYTITNLTADTKYDIKMEGTDYLYGGKLIATKSISISTAP